YYLSESAVYELSFSLHDATLTTATYTLSLHDALPICRHDGEDDGDERDADRAAPEETGEGAAADRGGGELVMPRRTWRQQVLERSEEHTSELQSPDHLVCRLLLEKKKVR